MLASMSILLLDSGYYIPYALMHDGMRSYESDVIVRVPIFAKINEARCVNLLQAGY
jgi:hypothetical protein